MFIKWLVNFLSSMVDFFFALVIAVPMPLVRLLFILILISIAVWIFFLPKEIEEGKRKTWWNDLRYFALLVLFLQIILYIIF
ncbi:hypothetical protein JW935_04615 [candidate division KSB1 bacterium]|nr:hypothetical protein [candidate division KSB1 bacterium]